ncbi:MAG: hypothetical protein M3217_06375 [Actinomycetota bacterium]|nr:hypothetical protein [Actinomycetota bacterium]
MEAIEGRPTTRIGAGHVAAAAIAVFVVYALVGGLKGTGRHFVELGAMRIVLFGALLAFAQGNGASARRLGRAGLVIAGMTAVTYLAGGIGAVATDGWSYDVLDPSVEGDPPWYAYVIGASAMLFALGTLLVGIAGRAGSRLAVAVILAGAMFPLVFVLESALGFAGAHALWLAPWMALSVGLAGGPSHDGQRRAGRD